MLKDLRELPTRNSSVECELFQYFMAAKLQPVQIRLRFVNALFLDTMHLFGYGLRDKWKLWEENGSARQMALTTSTEKSFGTGNEGKTTVCDVISTTSEECKLHFKRPEVGKAGGE